MPRWKNPQKSPRPTVVVSQEIIDTAKRKTSGHCMIAEAVKAHPTLNAANVSVDLATIRWTDKARGVRIVHLTPRSVQMRLVMFEGGITPLPFSFSFSGPAQIRDVTVDNAKAVAYRNKRRSQNPPASTPAPAEPTQASPRRRKTIVGTGNNVPVVHGGLVLPKIRGLRREFGLRALVGNEKRTMGENWEDAIRRAAANPEEIGRARKSSRSS